MNFRKIKLGLGIFAVALILAAGLYRMIRPAPPIPAGQSGRNMKRTAKKYPKNQKKLLAAKKIATPVPACDALKNGETFAALMHRNGFTPAQTQRIVSKLQPIIDLKRMSVGTAVEFFRVNGAVTEIRIRRDVKTWVHLYPDGTEDWTVKTEAIQPKTDEIHASGMIKSSLWQAAMQAEIPPETILDLADIFAWQVDFASDLRAGDSFSLVYEMQHYLEQTVPGNIVAARFTNQNNTYFAFEYILPGGAVDYFDENGNATRRSFLKSPLRYRYISSRFSYNRFHPILKIYRPHLGVDYAAPSGTPVSALGDGTVIYRGKRGGYGNYVEIKHGDAYHTCYGHLSRFGKGIRKGVKVRQGQIIGYVGATGIATGPHLDFRVKYRGKFINPLNLKSPPAKPIPDSERTGFEKIRDKWMKILKQNDIRKPVTPAGSAADPAVSPTQFQTPAMEVTHGAR